MCYKDYENDYLGFSYDTNAMLLGVQSAWVGMCFCMMFLPVLLGRLNLVGAFLGASFWNPFAKMAFSTYLMQSVVIKIIFFSEEYGYNLTLMNLFADFVYCVIMCWIAGLALYILVEAPFACFVSYAKKRPQPKQEEEKGHSLIEFNPKE